MTPYDTLVSEYQNGLLVDDLEDTSGAFEQCVELCQNLFDEETVPDCEALCETVIPETIDDDPQCAYCGVYVSEHYLFGYSYGCYRFQTAESLQKERNYYKNMTEDERLALDEYEANGGIIY
jgi:hypothetical protein